MRRRRIPLRVVYPPKRGGVALGSPAERLATIFGIYTGHQNAILDFQLYSMDSFKSLPVIEPLFGPPMATAFPDLKAIHSVRLDLQVGWVQFTLMDGKSVVIDDNFKAILPL